MTKAELLTYIAAETDLNKADIEAVLKAAGDAIVEVTSKGDSVRFPNLGVFKHSDRSARKARNPRTGETVEVAAKRVLKFTRKEAL